MVRKRTRVLNRIFRSRKPDRVLALIGSIENGKLVVDNNAEILEMIETILVYNFPKLSREEIQYVWGQHRLVHDVPEE